MKTIIICLVIIVCFGMAYTQTTPDWLWVESTGGNGRGCGNGIATDNSGNSYVTGYFEGTTNFGDTILNSSGGRDMFVGKKDSSFSNGNWLWIKRAGGTSLCYGRGICIDSSGNCYIIGYFRDVATFGTLTLTSSGGYDIFIAKLDTNGNWLWAKRAGGSGNDYGYGISTYSSGDTYITGMFEDAAVFGSTTLTGAGVSDIFVARLDTSGNWQWASRAGGTYNDGANSIAVRGPNVYLTGYFFGSATFGSYTLTSVINTTSEMYVAAISTSGSWLWAKRAGSTSNESGCGISTDSSLNCYVTGYFQGTVSFGTTSLTSSGGKDVFITKLDSSGNWQWALRAGGTSDDLGWAISTGVDSALFITGCFNGTASFGTTSLTSGGYEDVFIAKLTTYAFWNYALRGGGAGNDEGVGISCDGTNICYTTGFFTGEAGFGYWVTGSGESEMFLAKEYGGSWFWGLGSFGQTNETGTDISTDSSGNSYVTGNFQGVITFGTTKLPSAGGKYDIFIAKLDANGNYLWAKRAGGAFEDVACGIDVDSSGNCYITGYFSGTAVFGSTSLTSSGNTEIYVAKLDSNGNWLWAVKAGGAYQDHGYGIAVDTGGNAYVTGNFNTIATFGGITLPYWGSYNNVFVAKISPNGTWLWATPAVSEAVYVAAYGIDLDSNGNIYTTGQIEATTMFGSIELDAGLYGVDIFVAKMDASGNWLWAKKAGGAPSDKGCGISTDSYGNCWVTGFFGGTASFGTTYLTCSGTTDIFVCKLDTNGNWIWAVRAGGSGSDEGTSITTDTFGACYITGDFQQTAAFGSLTATSWGEKDIFVAKFNGYWLWAEEAGGSDDDMGLGISMDNFGYYYVTGFFNGYSHIGSIHPEWYGGDDIFVAKISNPSGSGVPLAPQNLIISHSGSSIILQWSPVTQDTNGQPITPDSYRVYYRASPYGIFTAIGSTANTQWSHTTSNSQGFYKVTAIFEIE